MTMAIATNTAVPTKQRGRLAWINWSLKRLRRTTFELPCHIDGSAHTGRDRTVLGVGNPTLAPHGLCALHVAKWA